MDIHHLRTWLGRTEAKTDDVTRAPIAALAATLDHDTAFGDTLDTLPPLWHWLYFLPHHRTSEIGPDGHPTRGGFLPPVTLPRRMWAGGRLQFHHPLHVGEKISRLSRIVDVSLKEGKTGPLVFVLVRHEISNQSGVAVTEEHDIVYRDNPLPDAAPPKPQAAPSNHSWSREVEPSVVMLFRYSALTFNGHRIHYDRPYVTETEGYPGLVVHGPLLATLLMDLLMSNNPGANVTQFSFRAIRPVFDTAPFHVCGRLGEDGKSASLWIKDAEGWLAMEASAVLA
jgi:3-methylfumaryl-CoA hydratase